MVGANDLSVYRCRQREQEGAKCGRLGGVRRRFQRGMPESEEFVSYVGGKGDGTQQPRRPSPGDCRPGNAGESPKDDPDDSVKNADHDYDTKPLLHETLAAGVQS